MSDLVLCERRDGVAVLTFNRPDKLNALCSTLLAEFDRLLHDLEQDPAVRVIVLTGAGPKAFVAGADISEYFGQDVNQFVDYQIRSRKLFTYLETYPRPVIGAINGYALGGGFEIALCCDVLVSSTRARFGLPEGLLGLCPGGGGTQRLTRAVGRFMAADLLLSARRLTAEEALSLGLVSAVVEPGELLPAALRKAEEMKRVAPLAAREMKRLLREGLDAALETGLSLEQEVLFRLYQTKDAAEGIAAFVQKRQPEFQGK